MKFEHLLPRDSHVPSFNAATVKYNWHHVDYEGMNTFLLDVSRNKCNKLAHSSQNYPQSFWNHFCIKLLTKGALWVNEPEIVPIYTPTTMIQLSHNITPNYINVPEMYYIYIYPLIC